MVHRDACRYRIRRSQSRRVGGCRVLRARVAGGHRSVEKDTAVVGAAILAVSALNDTDPWQQAATIAQYDQVFEPDSVAQKWYDGAFELYKASYDALHDVHRRLRYLNKGQA